MRRTILFVFLIICTIVLILFVFSMDVNQDEWLFVPPIPPDTILTDGTALIEGSANISKWYYMGTDNKFHLYQNDNSVNDSSDGGSSNSDFINDDADSAVDNNAYNAVINEVGVNNRQMLFYTGSLGLNFIDNTGKYSKYHYPDKLHLQIFYKDNLIYEDDEIVINYEAKSNIESSNIGGSNIESSNIEAEKTKKNDQGNDLKNSLINDLKSDAPHMLLSEFAYPIYQPKENGFLLYKVTAFWDESKSGDRGFYGEAVYEFNFFNDVPIEFEVSSYQSFPGELITIFAKYANEDEKITLKSDAVEQEIPFYEHENGRIAILPLSYYLQPAEYVINLRVEQTGVIGKEGKAIQSGVIEENKVGEDGRLPNNSNFLKSYEIIINVLNKDFPIQYLTVSEELDQSTRNDEAYEEYDKYVGAVRKTNTPVKMWDGVFLKPVEGPITTEFGMRRFVNDAPTSYRHSGIDIAADRGTPVKATNSGMVILARYLIHTGNTVLIDHGYGIISWSYHMDSLQVKEGDKLVKGQIIGTVGSTGFSTGPHLHFAISVHDIFTNPWTLFEHEPLGF